MGPPKHGIKEDLIKGLSTKGMGGCGEITGESARYGGW